MKKGTSPTVKSYRLEVAYKYFHDSLVRRVKRQHDIPFSSLFQEFQINGSFITLRHGKVSWQDIACSTS